ncbi:MULTISPECIES: hypothetical protein [Pseudomonas syringae group]|uniref:hypothetical protein n=1 Tax=Pseudomonas syringae group TaxID=136849 RepID=UPI0011149093|nr:MULTISPECIES: hypothetical protein [Pseudomonas syringae group]
MSGDLKIGRLRAGKIRFFDWRARPSQLAETVDPLPNGQALVWRLPEANGAWVEGPVSPLVHLDDLEMVADAAVDCVSKECRPDGGPVYTIQNPGDGRRHVRDYE